MGSRLLLIDEDTTATNFMIRDARMQVCQTHVIKKQFLISAFCVHFSGIQMIPGSEAASRACGVFGLRFETQCED